MDNPVVPVVEVEDVEAYDVADMLADYIDDRQPAWVTYMGQRGDVVSTFHA